MRKNVASFSIVVSISLNNYTEECNIHNQRNILTHKEKKKEKIKKLNNSKPLSFE